MVDSMIVGGLEVFHKPTSTWHSVTPVKDAFVVNIGDMMGKDHCTALEECH